MTNNELLAGGRMAFQNFLKCEYSEENILFWTACEELKREQAPAVIEEKARLIYEDYISILSPKEVSYISILFPKKVSYISILCSKEVSYV